MLGTLFAFTFQYTRKEKRTLHHQGDGIIKIDGKLIDLRERMVKWRELVD